MSINSIKIRPARADNRNESVIFGHVIPAHFTNFIKSVLRIVNFIHLDLRAFSGTSFLLKTKDCFCEHSKSASAD